MTNLKISIITVCYNSEKTIKSTLESVANQTFKNVEHIIVDGKSTDKTLDIIKSFSHIKKIISDHDDGIYHAMNKGLELASGDIIGYLNSDDLYASNKVLSSVAKLFSEDMLLDSCYSDLVYVKIDDTSKIIRYWEAGNFNYGLFAKGWSPPHPTFFVRSNIYRRFENFNLKYNIASDVDLMMRFLEVYKISFCYVPEIWVKMRMGGTSNKNLSNIWLQNKEVISALYFNGFKINILSFIFFKLISRLKQFLKKP